MGKAVATRLAWFRTADNPRQVEHVFGVDADDPELPAYAPYLHGISPAGGQCSGGANAAAAVATGTRLLILIADDLAPFPGWDTALLAAAEDQARAVLSVGDGNRRDGLLTHPVITRARYAEQGWLLNPAFPRMFADNDHTYRARRDGIVVETSLAFDHQHPGYGKGAVDARYRAQNAPEAYQEGWQTLLRLYPELRTDAATRPLAGLGWVKEIRESWLETVSLAQAIDTPPPA
jgi:hypothetical protein